MLRWLHRVGPGDSSQVGEHEGQSKIVPAIYPERIQRMSNQSRLPHDKAASPNQCA